MLRKNYGRKSDVWSIGVICYVCLSGVPPFNGYTDKEIIRKVKKGQISFAHPRWNNISDTAKDFIVTLINPDEKKRPTAAMSLIHPFILEANKL